MMIRTMTLWPSNSHAPHHGARGGGAVAQFRQEAERLKDTPARLERLAERTTQQLGTMSGIIKTLVTTAPLLGLLGTVIGMVEMFGSLQGALGPQGETTVAGGISTALVTTQLGLIIAAPGIIVAYWLNRQQIRRERDVQKVLCSLQQEAP